MKKGYIYITLIAIVCILICFIGTNVYAGTASMPNPDQLHGQGKNFIDQGQAGNKIDVNKIAEIMKPLASLLLGIGTVVLVVVGSVMGIKYMASTPDVQAKLKTQLIGVVVSAVVLYGAYGIWSIAYRIMTDITG